MTFGEEIYYLVMGRDAGKLNSVIANMMMVEMTIHFNMLGSFMKHIIEC